MTMEVSRTILVNQSCPFWSSNENDKITYDSWEISDIAAEYELRIYSNEE